MQEQHDPWIAAAREYAQLDERGRLHYWAPLSPEQQAALTATLNRRELQVLATTPQPVKKRGIFSVAVVGCLGYVFGAIGIIALQIVLLVAGIRGAMPDWQWDMTRVPLFRDPDPMPEYCKDGMLGASDDERFDCGLWAQRHSEGGSWGHPDEP
jgi:hypothetical protein